MASMDPLPIHFFTIVLNGQPFITYRLEAFRHLPFEWHWHVVEGVAQLAHDTAWSARLGGRIEEASHNRGRSVDGTSAYLDRIAAVEPERITLYRTPPAAALWAPAWCSVAPPRQRCRPE